MSAHCGVLRIEATGLGAADLVRGLEGTVIVEDLELPVIETLQKAWKAKRELHLPTERWLLDLVRRLERRYKDHATHTHAQIERWLDGAADTPLVRGWGEAITKAQGRGLRLTAAQVHELLTLIRAHFSGPPGGPHWTIPADVWVRWQRQGLVVRGLPLPEIADAYVGGRLYQVLEAGHSWEEMKRLAASLPLSRLQTLGAQWAQEHAGTVLAGFGEGLAAKTARTVRASSQRDVGALVTRYLRGDLRHTGPMPADGGLTLVERDALETARRVDSPKALAGELRSLLYGRGPERDWLRVAVSETRLATNVGRVTQMAEDGVDAMYWLVQVDACRECKRLLLHPDGTPRRFPVGAYLARIHATGGLNIGRKASLIGDPKRGWVATALLHPWCRCVPLPVLKGYDP
jgi:hypothetical protein